MPVRTLGTLTAGLGINSRIGMKQRGVIAPSETIVLAQILDLLGTAIWAFNGRKGSQPESQLDAFRIGHVSKEPENSSFRSGEDFESARRKILERIK